MKRVIFGLLALTLVTGWASPGWAAGLKLTIRDGRVSLDAQDVTIRQILTEWARVGKTRIVNLERVTSAPVTLKFDGLPEDQALDIILRTLPGYLGRAPRRAGGGRVDLRSHFADDHHHAGGRRARRRALPATVLSRIRLPTSRSCVPRRRR